MTRTRLDVTADLAVFAGVIAGALVLAALFVAGLDHLGDWLLNRVGDAE